MEGNTTQQGMLSASQLADEGLVLAGHSAWPTAEPHDAGLDRFFLRAPAGMLEVDAGGRLLAANPAFCRMTGYWPEELVGRSLAEFVANPNRVERLRDLLHLGSGVDRFELDVLRRDGTVLHAVLTAGVAPAAGSGDALTVIALVEDASPDAVVAADDGEQEACVDAVEAVAGAVAQARENGVGIAYAYTAEPVWVRVDEAQLRLALDDLLDRAVRSTVDGSVAIRCTAEDDAALLEIVAVPEQAGAGIDLGDLFGPAVSDGDAMSRIDAADAGPMHALVQGHHGLIEESRGRVTVRLPRAAYIAG